MTELLDLLPFLAVFALGLYRGRRTAKAETKRLQQKIIQLEALMAEKVTENGALKLKLAILAAASAFSQTHRHAKPSPKTDGTHWRTLLGFSSAAKPTPEAIQSAYREKAKIVHPDHGGTTEQMALLNAARSAALQEMRVCK